MRVRKADPASDDLETIPGVGPSIAEDLRSLGFRRVGDLAGGDPERIYLDLCAGSGGSLDRCMLYVLRCATYYASHRKHDPRLLKWWNWKDRTSP